MKYWFVGSNNKGETGSSLETYTDLSGLQNQKLRNLVIPHNLKTYLKACKQNQ